MSGELVAQHQLLQGSFRTSRNKEHFEGFYKLKRDNNKIMHERRLDDLKKPSVESLIIAPPIDVERRDLSTYDLFMGGMRVSHDSFERLHENLLKLKLTTADEILDSVLEHTASQQLATVDVLDHLIAEELKARRTSAIDTNTKLAHLPVRKRMEDFDLAFQPSIDKAVFDDLRTLRFVAEAENLILLGPPGVGKTHIAIGLALERSRLATPPTTSPPRCWWSG